MATFLPIRTPNAIDQAVFVIKFSQKIGEIYLDEIRSLEQTLSDDFINFHEVKVKGVMMTPDGFTTQEEKTVGGACNTPVRPQEHLMNSERSDWTLNITEETIQINCLNYTGWAETINYVSNILAKIFECLSADDILIASINFQVNDTFVVQDSIDDLDYSQLFNQSNYLPQNVWSVGDLWHVHSGWFGESSNIKALNVLNISTRKDVSETVNLMVLVEHLQQVTVDPMIKPNDNKKVPVAIFNYLHEGNKAVISELLTTNIKGKIGLS